MLLASLSALLVGCGFSLRGFDQNFVDLKAKSIILSSYTPFGAFEKQLKRELEMRGAQVSVSYLLAEDPNGSRVSDKFVYQSPQEQEQAADTLVDSTTSPASFDSPANPPWVLRLHKLSYNTQGFSRDETGRANEHELTASLDFSLVKDGADDQSPVEVMTLTTAANYYQNFRDPIGGETQRRDTEKFLHNQLTAQLIERVQRVQTAYSLTD